MGQRLATRLTFSRYSLIVAPCLLNGLTVTDVNNVVLFRCEIFTVESAPALAACHVIHSADHPPILRGRALQRATRSPIQCPLCDLYGPT
jgi:hypothetical protein